MKRLFILSAFAIILMSNRLFAQISLEKTYNYSTIGTNKSTYIGLIKLSIGEKYAYSDNNMSKIYLYNLDNTLYKTINIQTPAGFSNVNFSGIYSVSDKLFNLDSKIEYIVIYRVSGDSINPAVSRNNVYIYNEDGSQLFVKEYGFIPVSINGQYNSHIQNTPDGTKLIISNQNSDFSTTGFSVYSLPGTLITSIKEDKIDIDKPFLSNPFPNPANEYTAVFYKLPGHQNQGYIIICDINGKRVQEIKINGSNEYVLLNSSNLSNGTYLYSLVVENQILDTKKMVITR